MSRHHKDWIHGFLDYAAFGEAPRHFYFWTAVSTIAGALQRKVWIDQAYFRWYPNFYIILVAPPGIVQKSTTASLGMQLLRQVPDVSFGPDVVTWQALLDSFEASTKGFEVIENGESNLHVMSALTLESSEFGNLLNTQDAQMIDLLVSLWDGKAGTFEKQTKSSGSNKVENPWINLIACTTPAWIAGNFPEYMIGGGFTSRCVFVYGEKKEKYVAYPKLHVPKDLPERAQKLIDDLTDISRMTGEMTISTEAMAWGEEWYRYHYSNRPQHLDDDRFGGYIARKQTHLHKLAMILSAAKSSSKIISLEDLQIAAKMVTDLEADMQRVFSKIGKSDTSLHVERLLQYLRVSQADGVLYQELYRYVHALFPSHKEFEDVIEGCVKSGLIAIARSAHGATVTLTEKGREHR